MCGTRDGLMQVSGRKHNTDDIIATVLAVEPMKFIYRGRYVILISITILRQLASKPIPLVSLKGLLLLLIFI